MDPLSLPLLILVVVAVRVEAADLLERRPLVLILLLFCNDISKK